MAATDTKEWLNKSGARPRGINLVQCATCVHFRAYERDRTVCDAYPGTPGGDGSGEGEIPTEIILSEVDHSKPYKGDHGIQREEGKPQMVEPADSDANIRDALGGFTALVPDKPGQANFAYNPDEPRDPHGMWTSGGASTPAGARTKPSLPQGSGNAWEAATATVTARVQAQGQVGEVGNKADSPHAETVNLGITAFRGKTTPSMQDVARYYGSTRFRGFENELLRVAAQRRVQVVEETRAAGVWEGNLEPAVSVTVRGEVGAVHQVAEWLGSRYYQDSVMLFTPHAPQAKGGMYVLDGVQDVPKALAAMQDAGLPGGRVVGTRLEIADDASEYRPTPEQVGKLADALGLRKRYTQGQVEWLNAGEAYKKGEHGRG